MPTITVNGEEIFYQARGESGPVVLFVHGAGGTWRHWGLQMRDLAGARCVALDLPGHGRSGGQGRQTIEDYAEVVLSFARSLDLSDITLVGHSMGGAITLAAARAEPTLVTRLGLVGTGARLRVHPDILNGLGRGEVVVTARMIARLSHRPDAPAAQVAQSARELAANAADVYLGDYQACDAFSIMEALGTISQPALVATGTEDQMTPPKYAHFLAEHLPNARLVLIPEAGHMLMLEQPAALTAALRDFLGVGHDGS
jgi:pimeloyl-ACP methyl ester carboxylesterase